ncbi:response regulator [Saccharibacillus sp. JS10]|uniref:response regulator n=1 Tax=Saccharibacillus sp. JS10 TaxID=2950552 RepID=UPI00210E7B73|nr:response regulator [Saccharibacillus sp. JS10]MCQ4087996.1 response regulator [Saccharibacillus sp. JS10]
MRAMLVDDEKPALVHLERLIRADGRLEVISLCTSAREGIELLQKEPIDVVFLDIGMPEMNGLEAAEYIQQHYPGIAIIFVTAYSEYAVEAFDLQAIDYLLKPIGSTRLQKAIARISVNLRAEIEELPAASPAAKTFQAETPGILMFRRLELYDLQAKQVFPVKWRTTKSQELFAYLLHQKEQWIPRDELIELLWTDMPNDKAATHLHTSVYQIRKLLKTGKPEMTLEYRQESYRLLRGNVVTDAEYVEQQFEQLIGCAHEETEAVNWILSLWRGGYLAHHDYTWAESRAEKLERQRFRLTLEFAQVQKNKGSVDEAIRLLIALQEDEPYAEEVCRELMTTYEAAGNKRLARECYQAFEQRLDEELGTTPEIKTVQIYERLS